MLLAFVAMYSLVDMYSLVPSTCRCHEELAAARMRSFRQDFSSPLSLSTVVGYQRYLPFGTHALDLDRSWFL